MRIHTNVLTAHLLQVALSETGLTDEGVHLDTVSIHRSTKRDTGIEFRLAAQPGRDRFGKARRPRNTGQWGAEQSGGYDKGATYDEHGIWMARLFEIDPDAIVGPYDGADEFHRMTRYQYGDDQPVAAAATLSNNALLAAAREGQALGICDED